MRDVLTMGRAVFADRWPAIAVLPKGKTNALNVDIGAPADWSLEGAMKPIPPATGWYASAGGEPRRE